MLNGWLVEVQRAACPYSQFSVLDTEAMDDPSDDTANYLQTMLTDALFTPGLLGRLTASLGWDRVHADIITRRVNTPTKVKRGDFGEALFCAMLEQFHGYSIPVPKLRFKVTPSQTLTGTDTLAMKLNDAGEISEVCYVETKLRTSRDRAVAVAGCQQLMNDYKDRLPSILEFVISRLHERNDPMAVAFLEYMRSRDDLTDIDTFRLAVLADVTIWREEILEDLEASDVEIAPLEVHAVRINALRGLVDSAYAAIGIPEIVDGD